MFDSGTMALSLRQLCINAIAEFLLKGKLSAPLISFAPTDTRPDIGTQLLQLSKVVGPKQRVTIAKRSSTDRVFELQPSTCGRLNVKTWELKERIKVGTVVNDSDPVKVHLCKKLIDNSPYVDSLFLAKQTLVNKLLSELNIIPRLMADT